MIPSLPRFRRSHTWLIAFCISICVIALGLLAWRFMPVKSISQQEFKGSASFITLQKKGDYADMTRDQSLLLDSAPLFLPTRWSTAVAQRVEYVGSETDLFEVFEPEITLNTDRMKPPATVMNVDRNMIATPVDGRSTRLLGRRSDLDGKLVMPSRGAYYEIHAPQNGKAILSGTMQNAIPEAGDLLWQPVEFWVRVVQEGVMGPPLLTNGSGNDSLDAALRNLVAGDRKIALLPPGYYRVVVGP
jgi:hypothetical protein